MRYLIIVFVTLLLHCSSLFSQTIFFQDDFEDGDAEGWNLGAGWQVIDDNGNYVLQSSGNSGVSPHELGWGNYVLEFRFKPIENINADALWIDVRYNSKNYYHFAYFSDHIVFNKILNGVWKWSEHSGPSAPFQFNLGQWYDFKFDLDGSIIKFFINNQLVIQYDDESDPITFGLFQLNTFFDLRAYFDDFLVSGEPPPFEAKWVRTGGPWGGIGYDVRIDLTDPDIMYVTDQWAGNHKSINGGATWYPNNDGIETAFGSTGQSIPIFTLRIDPNNTNNVWCGTFGKKGIYRSTDKGEHWEKKVNGIPDFPGGITFRGIAIRPGNSNVLFCAAEIPLLPDQVPAGKSSASRGKVFKSTDFGEHWREVLDSDALVRHIWINPEHPDTMYVSTGIFDRDCVKEEGVWKSVDGGESWFHVNNGLTDLTVGGLFMDPRNSDVLWACTGRESPWSGDDTGEIFKTTNGGELWTKVFPKGNLTVWHINSITTSGPNSNIIYAASEGTFYRSKNGGLSWDKMHYNIPGIYTGIPIGIAAYPTDENTVFINSYSGGVFGSNDGGNTWKPYNTGYTGAEMLDIIVDPIDPLQALVVGRSGTAKTADGGMTWQGAGNLIKGAKDIGIGPFAEQYVLAINHQNRNSFLSGAIFGPHLLKTTDKFNWVVIHDFRDEGTQWDHGIGAMQYAYNDSNIIYVGFRYRTLPLIIDRPQHFDPNIISYGMFKSTDGGHSWSAINTGLDETTKNIQAIAIHPLNPDTVYIGLYGFGVYKTIDGGNNWQPASNGIISYLIASLAIDLSNPNVVYAGAEDGGLYKTTDGGATWEAKMIGMDPEASIRSIVIDPTNSQRIYAADWHSGVYYSNDGGERWWPFNEGLTTRSVQKLAISSDGKTLYAATQGEGVFRLSYENKPPVVQYIYPENDTTITLSKDRIQQFIVGAVDMNGDTLSYKWLLNNTEIQSANEPIYTLNTSTLNEGNYTLICEISDGQSMETVIWDLKLDFNIAPIIQNIPDISFDEDSSFVVDLMQYASDDRPLTELSWSFRTIPVQGIQADAVSIIFEGDGQATFASKENWNGGPVLVILTATDRGGLSDSDTVNVTVFPVNDPPLPFNLIAPADSASVDISNIRFEWQKAVEVDKGDTVSYTVQLSTRNEFTSPVLQYSLKDTSLTLKDSLDYETEYHWRVLAEDKNSTLTISNQVFQFTTLPLTGIDNTQEQIPSNYFLAQNYPNPFNASTAITYGLPKSSRVNISIYNLAGQKVETLINFTQKEGYHSISWNPSSMASGIYIIRMKADNFIEVKKCVLVR